VSGCYFCNSELVISFPERYGRVLNSSLLNPGLRLGTVALTLIR